MLDKTLDERADALFASQHGVLSTAQALQCGLTFGQVRRRVEQGRWMRPEPRVLIAAAAPVTWHRAAMAACLAGPPGTVASHFTAAALHGCYEPPEVPHVTLPRGQRWRTDLAVVHYGALDALDITEVGAIPCTTMARTLVDCSAMLALEDLCELVDDALYQRVATKASISEMLARMPARPGRKGIPNLLAALEVWTPGAQPGSPAEMRMIRRLVGRGFPLPERQWKLFDEAGRFVARLDVAWPPARTGLEYFGERYHGPRQEERDRARLARIEELGWGVRVVKAADLNTRLPALVRWLECAFSRGCDVK